MKIHSLKTWPAPFEALQEGRKRFEFRRDDRGYEVGHWLYLYRWDPDGPNEPDPDAVMAEVTYIARGPAFGIPEGFCVMSIAPRIDD